MHTKARYPVRGKNVFGGRSGLVSGIRCLFENGNSKKFSQYFLWKLSFDKLSWLIVICLRKFFGFCQKWFFEFKCRFSWNNQPIFHLVRVSIESGISGFKNENPCFEKFSEVLGSWFRLGGGEESQGFPEVKNLESQNGIFTISSCDPKLSGTIFSFTIRQVEIKIFHFWDIGLEVERSQLVDRKISKWVFSHLFFSPPRTHRNWWNQIWMSLNHFMNVRRFTSYRLKGRWRVTRR